MNGAGGIKTMRPAPLCVRSSQTRDLPPPTHGRPPFVHGENLAFRLGLGCAPEHTLDFSDPRGTTYQ